MQKRSSAGGWDSQPFSPQVSRFPYVPIQNGGVSRAGSVPARKCTCALGPEFSLLQFFTTVAARKSYSDCIEETFPARRQWFKSKAEPVASKRPRGL